jgi:hypothetical protein
MSATIENVGRPWWEEPDGARSRRAGLAWLLLGLLAMLVFELTANPALAVTVGCLKLGGDGLASAIHRWRADPDPPRGRATALFLAAWSLWRVTGIAVLLFVLLAFLIHTLRPVMNARGARPAEMGIMVVTALILTGVGSVLAALTSFAAIACAWLGRVKVWIGRPSGDNRVKWTIEAVVALTACLLPFAGTLGMLGLYYLLGGQGVGEGWPAVLGLCLSCLVVSTLPAFSRAAIKRVVAGSPEADWPTVKAEAVAGI